MAAKRALITGITGQDGAYLSKLLLDKGYEVFGTYRRLSTPNFWRLQHLSVFDRVRLIPADLIDSSSIAAAIDIATPDEIYHLAAQSFVGASFEQPVATGEITGLGVVRILETIRRDSPKTRLYQASTSEQYGNPTAGGSIRAPKDENTPFAPVSPYGAAKLYGYWLTRIYREAYGLYACNGILFNHESPLRGLEFVTRKISNAAAQIKLGLRETVELGNLDAERDWGYAPEYVEAMWLMLQQSEPDDCVAATGEFHSVREFAETAFGLLGLDWRKHVTSTQRFARALDINQLCGNPAKAKAKLGWEPKVKFRQLVEIMVKEDLSRWERWKRGEAFPWDAPVYPSEATIVTKALKA